jgi:NAD(P)-dependent dehydrogenase (short-subunit alcohol dehydrogenase family)
VALVVGGGRGVGRAVALQLALEGALVVVSYGRGDAEGASVARELQELGTLAHAFEADVSQAEDVRRLFELVNETYGRLDLMVNCAGLDISESVPLDELTPESWDKVLNLTLKGSFLCAQAAAGLMRRRPSPSIVNVALEAGLRGESVGAHLVAAHAGVVGLTKALARELAPRIRVNCVAVASPEAEMRKYDDSHQPTHSPTADLGISRSARKLAPDDIARSCIYLLSADAASINGQTLIVGTNSKSEG